MAWRKLSQVAWAALLCGSMVAQATVQVIEGPTPIVDGEAKAAGDLTLVNDKLAVAIAVQSGVPYGVPRGAIIDLAPVVNGKVGRDRAVFADFIPNNWSAWPNTYQRVDVLERGPTQVVVRSVRDWGRSVISTVYTLRDHADHLEIETTMRNDSDIALTDLLSGLTLWPKGGFLFGLPGMSDVDKGDAAKALSDRVVAYDEQWMVALHAGYVQQFAYGSKDLYQRHSLAPGESRSFAAWLQVGASGDLAPVLRAEIERRQLASGVIEGSVSDATGAVVAQPVVVIEKEGKPYAWVMGQAGKYSVTMPVGNYSLYAAARNYSQSAPVAVSVAANGRRQLNISGLEKPGGLQFRVSDAATHRPLDARITIAEGQKPVVGFLGKRTFFTELLDVGRGNVSIAPGRYLLEVASGGAFLGDSQRLPVVVSSGRQQAVVVALTQRFNPGARGWYSADLHHHADQAEAVTPPADMARSQLAAGLSMLFVSDHDSTINFSELSRIAAWRHRPFIAGVEISPSWGHFNAYPLAPDAKLTIDTSKASIDEVLQEGRRMGATVVQANHPFIPYGYLTSVAGRVAPGGFNPGFDALEINGSVSGDDVKVLRQLWSFWNAGHRVYLSAGTDTHDVWLDESGRVRLFAHLSGSPDAHAFAQAIKDGHAYVSAGPLIYPSVLFGDSMRPRKGAKTALQFELQSVAGLKSVELIAAGEVVATKLFEMANTREARVEFPLGTEPARWYSLVVTDQSGRKAYTNPIWVDDVPGP